MGANLVTAYWNPSDTYTEKKLKQTLEKIAIKHGASVNVHPNMATYKSGKNNFSAEISGFSIPWHGGQAASVETLKNIKRDWEKELGLSSVEGEFVIIENFPC
jgi:hypothetical protein